MKIKLAHVCANVTDLEKSVQWYEEILGFECDTMDINEKWSYADFKRRGETIFGLIVSDNSPSFCAFNFEVEDIDALWEKVKDEVYVVQPLAKGSGGVQKFTILDLDGNVLSFLQDMNLPVDWDIFKNDNIDELPAFDEMDLHDAQQIMYDAWEYDDDEEMQAIMAKKALSISPYCIDAYNTLAQVCEYEEERIALYRQSVRIGRIVLGNDVFREDAGSFWSIIETRPYMRALAGLAHSLWDNCEEEEAILIGKEILHLNENDNLGIRYALVHWFIETGEMEEADKILKTYTEESAFMMYARVLFHFKQGQKVKAKNTLKKALEANFHIPAYLLAIFDDEQHLEESDLDGIYQHGDTSEAEEYARIAGDCWACIPGALLWLIENVANEMKKNTK